jgi:hypothetical protein
MMRLFSLSIASARYASFIALLVFMSVLRTMPMPHAVEVTENMRDFWWQVAWRAPNIQPGTTLVANYPVGAIQEDYFVWGPANFIYYPENQNVIPIKVTIPAAVLTNDVVLQILIDKGEETPLRRGNELTRNFGNVLVMTQSSANSCVRLIDGNSPDLSIGDPERILLIAPNSRLENVITDGQQPLPPPSIFGSEPEHNWCFYYQKADLARQRGDWEEVARLGAGRKAARPNDQIELMPFLQAYALRITKQVKEYRPASIRNCLSNGSNHLKSLADHGYSLSAEMRSYVDKLFCK